MRQIDIRLEDAIPIIKEKLSSGGSVAFSPRGTSMLPFLVEGRDSVTLSSPPEKIRKYDVVLYRRSNGQYVLHRVISVRAGQISCIGDNQFAIEKGIYPDQVIAVCSSFTRKGRSFTAGSLRHRVFAILWHKSRFLRRACIAAYGRISRIFKLDKKG